MWLHIYIYIYIVYVRIYVITIKPTRNLVISSNLAIRLGHQLVPSGLPHQGWAIHPSQKGVGATSDRPISVQPSQCMGICACAVQVVTWCRSWPRTMAALHRNAHNQKSVCRWEAHASLANGSMMAVRHWTSKWCASLTCSSALWRGTASSHLRHWFESSLCRSGLSNKAFFL